jgi:hypothetical protein
VAIGIGITIGTTVITGIGVQVDTGTVHRVMVTMVMTETVMVITIMAMTGAGVVMIAGATVVSAAGTSTVTVRNGQGSPIRVTVLTAREARETMLPGKLIIRAITAVGGKLRLATRRLGAPD